MSYIDSNRSASFGAGTLARAASALADTIGRLRADRARRAPTITQLSPAQLEDIGVSLGDLEAGAGQGLLARAVAAYSEWRLRRSTFGELSRLGDAQLHDIGLTRADVEHLRYGGSLD